MMVAHVAEGRRKDRGAPRRPRVGSTPTDVIAILQIPQILEINLDENLEKRLKRVGGFFFPPGMGLHVRAEFGFLRLVRTVLSEHA